MATGRISKRTVDATTLGARDVYLWDADLAGFGLKVTPTGSKVYLAQYRIGGRKGRTRRVTIGRHGTLTPDQARREARRLLGEVAAGRDPAEARAKARRELTVAELCELYLAEGVATKKQATVEMDRSRIARHIKPLLGHRQLRSITRADIERFMQDVAAGKTACDVKTELRGRAIVTGGKGAAVRALGLLGGIFTFAVDRGLRPDNPAHGIKRYAGRRKERFLSSVELARLGEALAAGEREGEHPSAVTAVRLLAFTGCRKSEILTLRWEYVDMERSCLRLPDSKTGAKVIPLGAPALELLASLPRVEGNPHVLPGARANGHYVGLPKAWQRIRRRAGLDDVRLHDLRHSFASVAVAGGDSLYLVGKVLGHRQSRTTEVYAHLADDPLRAVADRTARQIAAAMNRKDKGDAELVELPKRKA